MQDREIEARKWLAEVAAADAAASSAKRDAREEETFRIAKRANLIAWIAAAIAITSILKEIIVLAFK